MVCRAHMQTDPFIMVSGTSRSTLFKAMAILLFSFASEKPPSLLDILPAS